MTRMWFPQMLVKEAVSIALAWMSPLRRASHGIFESPPNQRSTVSQMAANEILCLNGIYANHEKWAL